MKTKDIKLKLEKTVVTELNANSLKEVNGGWSTIPNFANLSKNTICQSDAK